jgi:hypothetical protein
MATKLQDSDRDLLRYCHELRFATIDHLVALTGRLRQALNVRILQLAAEKYLYRITFPNPNQKHIYTIGTTGFQYLAHQGIIPIEDVPERFRANELKPLFLNHTLFVSDIHATLLLASRASHLQLADWQEGKGIYDDVTFYEDGRKVRLPVCPDGFFTLRNTRRPEPLNRLSFALEADRSTTTRRTFDDKLRAYCNYLEQKKQERQFNVRWFRVVTITLTQARADSLRTLARESVPDRLQKFFLFTSREYFSLDEPEYIYYEIYRSAKDEKAVSLVPA